MVFFKNIELCHMNDKYDGSQRGLFAREKIHPGELIWYCECGEDDSTFTFAQLLSIIEKYPKLDNFVRSYSYMIDDDIFAMPVTYSDEKNNDECAFFNHSCDPNCGFDSTGNGIRAIKTIEAGDELAYHYGFLETEVSLTHGLECKCGSVNCKGKLLLDLYRDENFVHQYFDFFTPYLRKKVIDMREKWYSENCYVKRVSSNSANVEDWDKALFTQKNVKKDELVAVFSTNDIFPCNHFLRHSVNRNCYIKDGHVFANVDIPSESELTIYYHGVLL